PAPPSTVIRLALPVPAGASPAFYFAIRQATADLPDTLSSTARWTCVPASDRAAGSLDVVLLEKPSVQPPICGQSSWSINRGFSRSFTTSFQTTWSRRSSRIGGLLQTAPLR